MRVDVAGETPTAVGRPHERRWWARVTVAEFLLPALDLAEATGEQHVLAMRQDDQRATSQPRVEEGPGVALPHAVEALRGGVGVLGQRPEHGPRLLDVGRMIFGE